MDVLGSEGEAISDQVESEFEQKALLEKACCMLKSGLKLSAAYLSWAAGSTA